MYILAITLFVIWIYLLTVLTRAKLSFFKFVLGAVGMFFFSMFFFEPYLTKALGNAVALVSGVFGKLSGFYEAFPKYSLLFISRENSFISFYIDYECSGIIEILAFLSLLWFFPIYNSSEKVSITLLGTGWIFMANVIRIFVICTIIYYGGNNIFYFAHTVFGRILFYGFSVVLYFYVFTKSHIIRQKVGSFSYGNSNDKNN